MFTGLKEVVGFLTILPVKSNRHGLEVVAYWMPLFPLVGLGIGMLAGFSAFLFLAFLPAIIAGMLTLAVLLLATGLHHVDGLLDFGDGIMYKGSREQKLHAMRDTMTGAGGLAWGLVTLMTLAFAISSLRSNIAPLALASAETTAKLSMVLAAGIGKSASPGTNTLFIDAMHQDHRITRLILPLGFAIIIAWFSGATLGLFSVVAGLVSTIFLVWISNHNFGGLTGDVFGTINEVTRLACLLVLIRL